MISYIREDGIRREGREGGETEREEERGDASAGSSLDWAYGVKNVKYSHVLELRDTGEYGFLLPEDQIEPTAIETFEGLKEVTLYHLLRVIPESASQVHYLRDLADNSLELNFWTEPRAVGAFVDIMVPPTMVDSFTSTLKTVGFDVTVNMEDVQAVIDQQMALNKEKRDNADNFDYNMYHSYEEIEEWIDNIAAENPDLAEVFEVTTSYEGRPIRGVKVTNKAVESTKKVFFHSLIHSREWVTGSTMLHTVRELIESYGSDPEITKYVDQIDFYIAPVLNADGYSFTWTDDRMWRKTRSPNDGSPCMGTDPNRNFNSSWGQQPGASPLPCADTYYGSAPFSEVETDGTSKWINANKPDCYIDFHSYSQMWMSPYGYTHNYPIDYERQAKQFNDIFLLFKDVVTGGTADWAYDTEGIVYAHATELRDDGTYGFLLPEDQIFEAFEETFAAIKVTCEMLLED
ncbi:carboxypeptidase B-like [Glandiceps talaboti]